MSKHTIIIVLGIWVAVLPFLGFPGFWKTLFFVFSGLGIIALILLIKNKSSNNIPFKFGSGEKKTEVYTENGMNDNTKHEVKNQ
ncbi:MAG: hypothetical protein QGG63_01145 [Candidatus Pacebacteria bacterium]|jgi:hypothetical protein|nr:hypothetical protein [Candidatus Paceibacterota bacterium]|tara:strand:+ start:5773 stop:6024 length:252 start_codon:yes stop_codon:yes gene_type:complete